LGIGMGLSAGGNQSAGREQMLTREQLIDLAREPPQLTREQIMELARVGGGSYEAGLAALGLTGALGPLGPSYASNRTGGGDHSGNGSGSAGGHISPAP
jgi:hypothetical protein